MKSSRSDVVVLGAGVAGLSAALPLARTGARVTLLDAAERVGGRLFSLNSGGPGAPVELGAEFVHGEPEELIALVREAGLELERVPDEHYELVNGVARPAEALSGVLELLESAPAEPDASALELSQSLGLDAEAAHWFAQFVEGFHAAPLDRVNACSILRQTRGSESQQRVVGGYGRLVEYLRAELERLGASFVMRAEARSVEVRRGHVSVVTPGLPVHEAEACIVALPLGVLRAPPAMGGVAWQPRPEWLAALVDRFEMGHVWRVTVSLREPVAPWKDLPGGAFVHALDASFPTWWSRPSPGESQLVAWCGGPKTARFARGTDAQEGALATLAELSQLTPAKLSALVTDVRVHDFINDPLVRGAYPYELVGGEDGPDLGPVAGSPQLLFAGDFLDADELGTVGAAVKSGTAAARVLLGARPAAA